MSERPDPDGLDPDEVGPDDPFAGGPDPLSDNDLDPDATDPDEPDGPDDLIPGGVLAAVGGDPGEPLLSVDPEVAAATADLDDESIPLVPGSAPLTLPVVEALLDQRRNEVQIEPTLSRITALLDVLGNPQQAFPVIQIAGTNGKTSTARMIDALLTRIGLRTGRFTSPHLQMVTERIALDGMSIDADRYAQIYADIAPYVDLVDAAAAREGGSRLSKFEILTAMAYAAFADTPVDVGVIEVGLGGTWDSTNVVDARISVLTPISVDHTEYLGVDERSIAEQKAGIIKTDGLAVIGPQSATAMDVLLRRAVSVDATVARFGSEFSVLERSFAVGGQRIVLQGLAGEYDDIFLPLAGEHQAGNAAVALAAVEAFFGAGAGRQLDVGAVQDAFAAVASPGRLERVRTSPTILVDAAHNPAGATALAAALATEFSFAKLVGVIAVMNDKDVHGILVALAGTFDEVVVTTNSSPRSMPAAELSDLAVDVFGEDRVHTAARMDEAIGLAVDLAEADADGSTGTGVVITGSVISAGDGRALAGLSPA